MIFKCIAIAHGRVSLLAISSTAIVTCFMQFFNPGRYYRTFAPVNWLFRGHKGGRPEQVYRACEGGNKTAG